MVRFLMDLPEFRLDVKLVQVFCLLGHFEQPAEKNDLVVAEGEGVAGAGGRSWAVLFDFVPEADAEVEAPHVV